MCAVSHVGDYGMQRDSQHVWDPTPPIYINPAPLVPIDWTNPLVREYYQKLIDAAKEFDEVAGEPDCPSEDKKEWMTEHGFYY